MEMEKLNYTEQDLKLMAVNSKQMIDLCNAKDKNAFREVQNRCRDLEKVSPEIAQELKKKAQIKQQMYDKTKNPNLFVDLVNDIQELYGRAFKLMIENFKRKSKAPIERNSFHRTGPVHNEGTLENAMAEKEENDASKSVEQSKSKPQPSNTVRLNVKEEPEYEEAQEKPFMPQEKTGLFGGKKEKAQVGKISLEELQEAQNEMNQNQQVQASEQAEREKKQMENYNKRMQERLNSKSASMSSSGMGMGMEMSRQKSKR